MAAAVWRIHAAQARWLAMTPPVPATPGRDRRLSKTVDGNLPEIGLLIDMTIRRIKTGTWVASTCPDVLNHAGQRYGSDQPRFTGTRILSEKSNRAFQPNR